MAITDAQRKKAEKLIYEVMNALDVTGLNTEHYKKIFNNMSNIKFENLFKKKFPLKFHVKPFEIEPKMEHIEKAAKIINIPLLEEVRLPHIYRDSNGTPVKSKECLVGYIHLRKEQQFLTKKNSMSTNIVQRDMKTGLLINFDKNGKTSDRETEALVATGLTNTLDEMKGPRADLMNSKNIMYNTISNQGTVSLKDLPKDPEDSLSLNLFNTYMLGAMIHSNLLNKDYYLPYTIQNKKRVIDRK